jgi:RHS repeat-associated protein
MTGAAPGTGATTTAAYGYDASGDRTSITLNGAGTTYAYDPQRPHRLTAVGNRGYSYDDAGNTTGDGLRSYAYNAFGRLSRVVSGSTTVDAIYNGQGQRVQKRVTRNGVTTITVYFYDDAGRLLGEYAANGALIQETVWLGNVPVATIRPEGIYYVQADHLGTPRAVLRPADNAVLWRWDGEPFGASPAQEAVVNGQPFKYHLRFAGQYLDEETGLHYNVMRDYDPATGRYVQADPIGLAGGINTFAYAGANPVSRTDRMGLMNDDVWPIDPIGTNGLMPEDWSSIVKMEPVTVTATQPATVTLQPVTVFGTRPSLVANWWNASIAGFASESLSSAALRALQAAPQDSAVLAALGAIAKAGTSLQCVFKTSHYASRLEAAGVNVASAEAAVAQAVGAMGGNMSVGADVAGRVTVDGVLLEFRAHMLPGGVINVCTLFPVIPGP